MDSSTARGTIGRDGRPLVASPSSDDLDAEADRLRPMADAELLASVRRSLDTDLDGHEKRRRQALDR